MIRVPYKCSSLRRTPLATLALSAGVAMTTSPALAQSRLSLELDRPVIASGETVDVKVFGHFPADAFALAEAQFDLFAPVAEWRSASSGALAGDAVLGASFVQGHVPSGAIQADPTNPMPIWQGAYQPDVTGPAFLRLDAKASYYAWYPSELTSSTAVGDADPGRGYLWVDPVHIPSVGDVAPGQGTSVDVLPDDRIVATSGGDMLVALLLPAVQKVREAAARMECDAQPSSAGVQVMLLDGSVHTPIETLSLNLEQVDPGSPESMYELTVGSVDPEAAILLCIIGPSGELICQLGLTGEPIARFDRWPGGASGAGRGNVEFEWKVEEGEAVALIKPAEPLIMEIPGKFKGEVAGPIEVHVTSYAISGAGVDVGIAGQILELGGLPAGVKNRTTIEFDSGSCIADFDGDGELSFFDFLAFQKAFAAGLRSADIDGDGAFTFFDFLAFQSAFAAGC